MNAQRKVFGFACRALSLGGAVLTGMLVCSSANAALVSGISVDGSLTDWGVNGVINGNNSGTTSNWTPTQGAWISEDSVGSGGYVGPGYGGQNFDAEALYTGFDSSTNTLYVALVTGFDIQGQYVSPYDYFAGDIFIDFGNYLPDNDNVFDPNPLPAVRSWDLAFILNGATAGSTSLNARRAPFVIDDSPTGVPGFNSGPLAATGGTLESNAVNFAYNDNGPWTNSWDHNVYEFSYVITDQNWLDLIEFNDTDPFGWTVHWTMSCGNDFLDVAGFVPAGTTPNNPVVPVPAAAPMALLGMGLLGLKRRLCRTSSSSGLSR